MTKRNFVSLTLVGFAVSMLGRTAYASDPVIDFSIVSNSSVAGVWSYGQTPTLGGAFSLLATAVPSEPLNPLLRDWRGAEPGFAGNYPFLLQNPTGIAQALGGTATSQPDELLLHPGPSGEYSVLRFVVPTSGSYQLQGAFTGRDTFLATTDTSILLNSGSSLFTGDININAGGNSAAFNLTQSFTAGDTLDFAVGFGNGSYSNDSTGLKLSITSSVASAPEPTTLVFLALGGALVLACRRANI
jgi:hypothetical protein